MSDDSGNAGTSVIERRVHRPSGTEASPRWRGRLHFGALVVSVPAAAALVARRPDANIAVYSVGLVSLFATSSAYHLLPMSAARRRVMRRVDHATIYVYMAAAYTPLIALALPRSLGRVGLVAVWSLSMTGAVVKLVGFNRARRAANLLYLLLGWGAAVMFPSAAHHLGLTQVLLIFFMGVVYTGGAMVLFCRRPDPVPHIFGYHEVWHASVIVASAAYYVVLWRLTDPLS